MPSLRERAGDRGRREMRGFQEHARGGVGDARVPAAHDAGQRNHAIGVGDHQEFRLERDFALVEQLHRLAGARAAHSDRAFQLVGVEGVHRLAQLEHHVVADVHQRADRAQAGAAQLFHQPQRRTRVDVQALDDAPAVARAVGAGVEPTSSVACASPLASGISIALTCAPIAAATSKAMPRTEKQSARLGVSLSSSEVSGKPR
jgi:hypothetical protein